MSQEEVIVFDKVGKDKYLSIALKAVKYALISVPFTFDRMNTGDLIKRISNIVKGKIGELLFYEYCFQNGINVMPDVCTTPFWLPDHRDFLWIGGEWDIKNNYFYCDDSRYKTFDCTLLPALIPNKSTYDQWSKRNDHHIESSYYNAYIFTFMRLKPDNKKFFTLNINEAQTDFLISMVQKFKNTAHHQIPFFESWFFETLHQKGTAPYLSLDYYPELFITGCANAKYWSLFYDIPSTESINPYLSLQMDTPDHVDPLKQNKNRVRT